MTFDSDRSPGVASIALRIAGAVGAITAGLIILATVTDGQDPSDRIALLSRIAGGAVLTLLLIWLLRRLDHMTGRQWWQTAAITPPRASWRAFGAGVLAWLLPAAAAFVIIGVAGQRLESSGSASETVTLILLLALAVFLCEALPEELVFRGYVLSLLLTRFGSWTAILIQTALFTGVAMVARQEVAMIDVSLFVGMGIGLGYLRVLTGTIWSSIGFHTAFQTGSQLVLTHDVVTFDGSTDLAMLALGAVPFAVGITLISFFTTMKQGAAVSSPEQ